MLDTFDAGIFAGLTAIHKCLFEDIFDFAGEIRTVNLAKGNFRFAPLIYLQAALENIDKMPQSNFDEIVEKYVEMNIAHPFREGNGRSTRTWLDHIHPEKSYSFDLNGIALVNAETDTQVSALGQYYKNLGKTVYAVFDKQDESVSKQISASVDFAYEANEHGIEDVVLKGIDSSVLLKFALEIVANGEWPSHLSDKKPVDGIHYHAVIHQALKYAMKTDLVTQNVAMKVDRPKKNDYQPVFLDAEELQHLFEVVKGTKLELPVLVAAFYGLRRGEVCGLKWDAIDFERGTITIRHTVTSLQVDGKTKMYAQDSAKTKSSMRTLPLVGSFAEYFKEVKAAQEVNKKVCGNCYNYEYDGYVFVDELGDLMRPEYLTSYFPQYIQKHGCKRMRFHDLRHSCASLLLANGVPLKQIQEWLGHSDFSTTANIYAHLDYTSKLSSAKAMVSGMVLPESVNFGSKWSKISDDDGKK